MNQTPTNCRSLNSLCHWRIMDVDSEPIQPQHVQELWFDDGNIVIQAGNRQFRVYRGVLAARSTVFQDMLSFPQPPDSELVEGCPLVQLHDSTAEVTVLLKAIFDSGWVFLLPSILHDTQIAVWS
jgi:hypothetical protein